MPNKQMEGLSRRVYNSKSTIEMEYFKEVEFYSLNNTGKWNHRAVVMLCGEELFTMCRETLRKHPDFQGSSYSIFGANPSGCIKVLNTVGNSKCVFPHSVIVGSEQHNKLWGIGLSLKSHFSDTKFGKYSVGEFQ